MQRGFRRVTTVALCVTLHAQVVRAQSAGPPSGDDLAGARALFADALRDEEANRFVDALDKFQRVRAVRDTAAIEYRIGTCYEGLGRAAPAYIAYRDATVLGQDDARSADVVAAAVDRLHALAKRVGWLSLVLPGGANQDVEVRVDEAVTPIAALREPVVLEPGRHLVTASARDSRPFRSEILLPEGAQVSLTIALEPIAPATSTPAPNVEPPPGPSVAAPVPPGEGGGTAPGWITVAAGGALLAGAGAVAIMRNVDISTLKESCPNGYCRVGSDENGLMTTRSRAVAEGPIAIALGAAGLVTVGIGAYLVFTAKGSASNAHAARVVPLLGWGVGGVAVASEFR
jgi:hypothetical protein